jgi:hypothetical protein
LEDWVKERHKQPREEKNAGILDVRKGSSEWQETMAHLFRHQVVLLAMLHGRAPQPVSPTLWKGLLRSRVLNNLYELGNVARRFSFLGDGRVLLAELRIRTTATPRVRETQPKESEIAQKDRP